MSANPIIPSSDQITEINSPDHKEIYANGTMVRMSPWDIGIIFSQQRNQNVRENQATIVMSPNHFKAFAKAMERTLETYETQFGTINVPDNLMGIGELPKKSNETLDTSKKNAKKPAAKKSH